MMRRGTLESLVSDPALLSDRFLRTMNQFSPGDSVESAISPRSFGTVKSVDPVTRKILVVWNSGIADQVDVDDIQSIPDANPQTVKDISDVALSNFFDVTASVGRRMAGQTDAIIPPNMVEQADPKDHGLIDPRGGGFSIMQNLQDDLREESLEKSTEVQASETGMVNGCRSRRALYHKQRGRVYQRSQAELNSDALKCPRCNEEGMEKDSFTRGVYLYHCPSCGWKITTDKLL